MVEIDSDIDSERSPKRDYLRILARRRWWLLGPFFSLGLLGCALTHVYPFLYQSEALILVEQQRVPEQYVTANVITSLQDRLDTMTQEILSRTRLQRIIEEYKLYQRERSRATMDEIVEKMRKQIRVELVQAPGRTNDLTAFRIHFLAETPVVAQRITNQLTSLFIEENLRSRTQSSVSTTNFLENQLAKAREDLATQEGQLREYKLRYLGELPEQLQTNLQSLSILESQLHTTDASLDRAEQQQVYLQSVRDQYLAIQKSRLDSGHGVGLFESREDASLNELRKQVKLARQRYTPRHPDRIRLESELVEAEAEAKAQPSDQVAADGKALLSQEGAGQPALVEVESRLKATAHEIESSKKEIAVMNGQIQELRKHLNTTPVREEQLAEVERNYENSKANYQSLLQKKLQSELATNLETRQQGEQFRIIDPASLPQKPEGMTRFLVALLGLAAGFGFGLGLVFLREFTDGSIRTGSDLFEFGEAKVIGSIPILRAAREERVRNRRLVFESVLGAALLIAVIASGIDSYLKG
jgi:polysaccharide biosynthesis transport protein